MFEFPKWFLELKRLIPQSLIPHWMNLRTSGFGLNSTAMECLLCCMRRHADCITRSYPLMGGFQHCNFPAQVASRNAYATSCLNLPPHYNHVLSVVSLLLYHIACNGLCIGTDGMIFILSHTTSLFLIHFGHKWLISGYEVVNK